MRRPARPAGGLLPVAVAGGTEAIHREHSQTEQYTALGVDGIRLGALSFRLTEYSRARQPVLGLVAVLGTMTLIRAENLSSDSSEALV